MTRLDKYPKAYWREAAISCACGQEQGRARQDACPCSPMMAGTLAGRPEGQGAYLLHVWDHHQEFSRPRQVAWHWVPSVFLRKEAPQTQGPSCGLGRHTASLQPRFTAVSRHKATRVEGRTPSPPGDGMASGGAAEAPVAVGRGCSLLEGSCLCGSQGSQLPARCSVGCRDLA